MKKNLVPVLIDLFLLDFTSAAIKQRMEKDVDEVKKTAYFLKTKVEELDKEV